MVHGWDEAALRSMAERLSGKFPRMGFDLTGLKVTTRIGGQKTVAHEYELAGSMDWPAALFRCTLSVDLESAREHVGTFHCTSWELAHGKRALVEAQLEFSSTDELRDVIGSLQLALAGNGSPYLNLLPVPLTEPDEWLRGFEDKGYSGPVVIQEAIVGAAAGKTFD